MFDISSTNSIARSFLFFRLNVFSLPSPQNKVIEFKRFFKEKNIITKNFIVSDNSISFETTSNQTQELEKILDDDNSEINPYFQQYKTHEFDFVYKNYQLYLLLRKRAF